MTTLRLSTRIGNCLAGFAVVLSTTASFAAKPEKAPPVNAPGSGAVVFAPDPFREPPRKDLDKYGGWKGLQGKATGYFHTEQLQNRWWLITPDGNAFYSLSMAWLSDNQIPNCKTWGFNTTDDPPSAPNDPRQMAYTVELNLFHFDKRVPIPIKPGNPPWVTFCDVFDPAWVEQCYRVAQERLGHLAKDPWMLGYFVENEPALAGWYEAVTHTAKDAPYRKAFVEVARKYYADKPDQLAKDWKAYNVTKIEDLLNVEGDAPNLPELAEIWQVAVAEQAFGTAAAAARKADPNHLNFGVRMINAAPPSPGVLMTMGRHVDVVSMNLYSLYSDRLLTQMFTLLPVLSQLTGKPIFTSEFTFRGGDTPCPNTTGAPPTVPTQADRAVGYLSYLSAVASLPFHVGACWYKYADDKLEFPWGEYSEDCNFGAVDGQGRPYAALVSTMRLINGSIYELAADPVPNPQCPLFYRTELMRWDRVWDQQFLSRFGQMDVSMLDPLAERLPEPRRYHEHYWIRHKGPKLVINDDGYYGWSSANVLRTLEDGQELTLLALQGFTSVPRTSWMGPKCPDPSKPFSIDSNAQMLVRRLDDQGRVRRMTLVGGSFVLTEFNNFQIRASGRVPYLDLQYDPEIEKLTITSQGELRHVGVRDVSGWRATWNGKPVKGTALDKAPGITSFNAPAR